MDRIGTPTGVITTLAQLVDELLHDDRHGYEAEPDSTTAPTPTTAGGPVWR